MLFTNYLRLRYGDDGLTQRIFGRFANTGLYLLMPDAYVSMTIASHSDEMQKTMKFLQSKSLGKQLVLAKMNRKI